MAFGDLFRTASIRQELDMMTARIGEIKLERDVLRQHLTEANTQQRALNVTLKAITEERDQLKERLGDALVKEYFTLRDEIVQLREAVAASELEFKDKKARIDIVTAELQEKETLLTKTDDAFLLEEFGLYTPKYKFTTVSEYKVQLDVLRLRQTAMARDGSACYYGTTWQVNGSLAQGTRMVREFTKLIVKTFNTECDDTIERVKFFNMDASRKRIEKSFALLNRLGSQLQIQLSTEYLAEKMAELELAFEYQIKKQEEKEEQRRLREKVREDAKLQREIDEARELLAKEERHFRRALTRMEKQLETATLDADRNLLQDEIALIQQKITEVESKRQDIDYRAKNAQAGYVYIISNLGAFGEGVFKIGVTRRLEPLDRIDELGGASVPFDFDVHALVFSDDAFALEAALHRHFADQKLNIVNGRKEFFRAEMDHIAEVLRESFAKPVEFVRIAEAAEYRQSVRLGAPEAPKPVKAISALSPDGAD
jgi:hypothetical protein